MPAGRRAEFLPWLSGSDATVDLMLALAGWMAEQESARRSEWTKAGMARPDVQAKLSARKPRGKDKRRRSTDGYSAAWTPERRAALAERNRQRAQGSTA